MPRVKGDRSRKYEYFKLYQEGYTMDYIGKKFGVCKATVSRGIQLVRALRCPFSSMCTNCPLPECAFKEPYNLFVNTAEDCRTNKRQYNRLK